MRFRSIPGALVAIVVLSLFACAPNPHTIVIKLQSDQNVRVTGTLRIDDQVTPVNYIAPTNLTITGARLEVHFEMKETNGTCRVTWYPKEWETIAPDWLEKMGATLNPRTNHFHILSDKKIKPKTMGGASEDDTPPWK